MFVRPINQALTPASSRALRVGDMFDELVEEFAWPASLELLTIGRGGTKSCDRCCFSGLILFLSYASLSTTSSGQRHSGILIQVSTSTNSSTMLFGLRRCSTLPSIPSINRSTESRGRPLFKSSHSAYRFNGRSTTSAGRYPCCCLHSPAIPPTSWKQPTLYQFVSFGSADTACLPQSGSSYI